MKLPRHAEIWLRPYLADRARRWLDDIAPLRHVWVLLADHYEPFWNRADSSTALKRVSAWRNNWPKIAESIGCDDTNRCPCYTFFYPAEQYHPSIIDDLAELTRDGIADVEVHIHHDGEGREHFSRQITTFCQTLTERHGLLREVDGKIRFGFIHGNWALDNSLPGGRACGLNDEITILRDLGCYADFTMPSGASPSQSRTLNQIYCCTDNPLAAKSYDTGTPVKRGDGLPGDLLMIPGPFGLRWGSRLAPRLETGEIAYYDLPSDYRARLWLDLAPRIGEHAFLKLYTHGAPESNLRALLDGGLKDLFAAIREAAVRRDAQLHFVSAWQMFTAIEALSRNHNPMDIASANRLASPDRVVPHEA